MKCWICDQPISDGAIEGAPCASCAVQWAESVRQTVGARVTREYRSNEERGLGVDEPWPTLRELGL